jgi:hypothetical protein
MSTSARVLWQSPSASTQSGPNAARRYGDALYGAATTSVSSAVPGTGAVGVAVLGGTVAVLLVVSGGAAEAGSVVEAVGVADVVARGGIVAEPDGRTSVVDEPGIAEPGVDPASTTFSNPPKATRTTSTASACAHHGHPR